MQQRHRVGASTIAVAGVLAASVLWAAPAHAVPVAPDVSVVAPGASGSHAAASSSVTVPSGVCSIAWAVTGGSGMRMFSGYTNLTGRGALLEGTTQTTAGTVYQIEAGGAGATGSATGRAGGTSPMGLGGAGSSVRESTASGAFVIAGGGGGNGSGGDGGDAGAAGTPSPHAGGGATTSAPGTAGTSNAGTNTAGVGGVGGSASSAGAGGGGLFGGGGAGYGSGFGPFGGGGGGSSLVPAGWTTGLGQRDTPGSVRGTYGLCAAPGVATGVQATAIDGVSATVSFVAPAATGAVVTGYAVSVDDGATWVPFTTTAAAGRLTGTVTGLTAGGTHRIKVRATYTVPTISVTVADSTAGTTLSAGASTAVALTTPAPVVGTPTAAAATATRSAVSVTWAAPSGGATIAKYIVTRQPGGLVCETTMTSCVFGGEAGASYSFTIVGETASGARGPAASATSAAVTAPLVPAAPPADAALTLTTDRGRITSVAPGARLTVIGTGFAPFSTASIVLYSSPIVLGSVTTDAAGAFSREVLIPADLAPGQHSVLAYGADPQGRPHSLRMNVSVAGGALALAKTGSEAAPLGIAGAVLLALGGVAVAARRGRRLRTR